MKLVIPKRLQQIALNLGLSLLSLAFTLLLVEIGLRIVFPADERGWTVIHEADEDLGWRYVVDAAQWYNSPGEFRVHLETNSLGQRDLPRTYAKPARTERILVLGDSFVASLQTPLTQTFVYRTEQTLKAARPAEAPPVEVLNAGTGGYGTDQALRWFRLKGRQYQPDHVVLAVFVGNDIADNDFELWGLAGSVAPPKPFFVLSDGELEDIGTLAQKTDLDSDRGWSIVSLRRALQRHSYTFALLNAGLVHLEGNPLFQRGLALLGRGGSGENYNHAYDVFRPDHSAEWTRAWTLTEHLLLTLRNEVEADGATFSVVLIPHPVQIHRDWWEARQALYPAMRQVDWDLAYPNQRLAGFLTEHEIAHLDLQPLLEAYVAETETYVYYRSDGHFTPTGNALVGDAIANWLNEEGVP